jgi:hypothetical protein
MQNETLLNSMGPKVADHERQSPTDSAPNGAHDATTAGSSPCRSSDREKRNAQDVADAWIEEAQENLDMLTTSEPCVVRGLLIHIDNLRDMLGKVFECIEYSERCGGLDYVTERKVRRALYGYPKPTEIFPNHKPGLSFSDHGLPMPNAQDQP